MFGSFVDNLPLDATHIWGGVVAVGFLVACRFGPKVLGYIFGGLSVAKMSFLVTIVGALALVGAVGNRIHQSNRYDAGFVENVKAAYNAETPAGAQKYMERAGSWVDEHSNQDVAHTSVLYPSPDENMHDWVQSFNDTRTFVAGLPAKVAKDNNGDLPWRKKLISEGLVKFVPVKEGSDQSKLVVVSPSGSSVYPYNVENFLTILFSSLIAGASLVLGIFVKCLKEAA